MKRECYRYILNNRMSGFHHPTRENIMGLFRQVQHSDGTIKEKVRHYFAELNGEQGVLNENDLTNLRYTLVNDCFYFCEYLLSNNVDNELVYNVSDYYINQVNGIKTQNEAMEFLEELAETFFELLAKKRLATYSFHVEKSIKYIDQKLYAQITLNDVAQAVGLTPQYLTTLFRQETGQTLYQYIKQKKIDEARMMLLYTGEPVTTIASSLGFSSSAHFAFAFQSAVGCTPTEFRNRRIDMFPKMDGALEIAAAGR